MENKSYKILFVDDDLFIREMYSVKFSKTDHEVAFASSAKEAIEILESGFTPDALVFDVIMPEMQGFDFLEELYKRKLINRNKTVIIALTNQSEKSDYDKARTLLVDEYIVKANYIPSEVISLIEATVDKFKNSKPQDSEKDAGFEGGELPDEEYENDEYNDEFDEFVDDDNNYINNFDENNKKQ